MEATIYSLDFVGVDCVVGFAHEGSYRIVEFWRSRWYSLAFVHDGSYRFVGFCPCGSFAILLIWYQLWGLFFGDYAQIFVSYLVSGTSVGG